MPLDWWFTSPGVYPEGNESNLAASFHEATKLNYRSPYPIERAEFSQKDLFVLSRCFRQYSSKTTVSLPEPRATTVLLNDALTKRRSKRELSGAISLVELSSVLQCALGPTAVMRDRQHDVTQILRAYPTAGALGSIDAYVICSKVNDVDPGIYHFNQVEFRLELVSEAIPKEVLKRSFFDQQFSNESAAGLVLVAVLGRLAPKYGNLRAYRLALLDAGHASQNVLLVADSLGMNSVPIQGFCDDELAIAIGIDSIHEIVLHAILIGASGA